jgi:diacylglycerol O-acyltransferase / wax synthase
MARTRMTNADAAWLHMDRITNLMIINSVMWFDDPVDWDRLVRVYEERLVAPTRASGRRWSSGAARSVG